MLCLICQDDCASFNVLSSSFQHSSAVSKEIHAFFILKHVLDLPSKQLENYLRRCPNPREWIRFCGECNENFIKKCDKMFGELVQVQRRFNAVRMCVISKIKSSWQNEISVAAAEEKYHSKQQGHQERYFFDVSKEIRVFVGQHQYENSSSDNNELLAGDRIAREMLESNRINNRKENENTSESNEDTIVKDELIFSFDDHSGNEDEMSAADEGLSDWAATAKDEDFSSYGEEKNSALMFNNQDQDDKRRISKRRARGRKKIKRLDTLSTVSTTFNHTENKESDLQIIKCQTCQDKFSSQIALTEHMLKVHKTFNCELCGKDFLHRKTLTRHVKFKHEFNEATFSCTFQGCKKSFLQKWLLDYHEKFHYPPQFQCHLCNKAFHIKTLLKRHLVANHETLEATGGKSFLCELCPTRYSNKACLIAHMKSNHKNSVNQHEEDGEDDQEPFRCSLCGKVKSSQESLLSHVKVVHERMYETCCDLCGKIFVRSNSLRRHKKAVHEISIGDRDDKSTKIKCPMEGCDRKFGTEALLKQHLSLHEKRPEFKCEHCGKKVFSARNLRSHVTALHTNRVTKPFKCSECGKGFAHKNYLWSHSRTCTVTRK